MTTEAYCGLATSQLSGSSVREADPPAWPVMVVEVFNALANWPMLPLARKVLKIVFCRSAAEPVRVGR